MQKSKKQHQVTNCRGQNCVTLLSPTFESKEKSKFFKAKIQVQEYGPELLLVVLNLFSVLVLFSVLNIYQGIFEISSPNNVHKSFHVAI